MAVRPEGASPKAKPTRLWDALLWLVTALVAAPFFLPGWLPLTDLPEHAAAMGSIARWHDAPFRIAEHYRMGWTTSQYLLIHVVGGLLTRIVGDAELACRILLVALAVGWVQSSRLLFRAFGLDPRLAILGALLFWNRALVVGFLPYVASLPILFATIALFVPVCESAERPRPRHQLLLAVASVVVFYAHASAFTLLVGLAGALTIVHAWDRHGSAPTRTARAVATLRDAVIRLAWLSPGALLAILWVVQGRFGMHGASIHDSAEIGTMSPVRAVKLIALYAHDIWTTHLDDWVGAGFWILFVILLIAGGRKPGVKAGSIVPFLVVFVIYLVTPFRVGTGLLLNVRMAPVLGFFALLGLRPVSGLRGTAPILCSIALAVVQCVDNVQQITRLQADVAGLPQLLGSIPKGSRLITLSFSGFDPSAAHFTPWLHVGSYHRAINGGVASFSFSELNHWSVQYRPEKAPPKQAELSWGMRPCLFRNQRDGAYFDFVLVRGALDPFAKDPPGPRWTVRGKTAKYTLYEKDASREPATGSDDDGPCPKAADR